MAKFCRTILLLVMLGSIGAAARAGAIPVQAVERTTAVDFEKEILPLLRESCLACHNRTKAKAGLVLETPADIRKGGDSGPAALPGKGASSPLLKAAAHDPSADSPMPPPDNKVNAHDLTPAQLGLVRLWIDQGAAGEVRAGGGAVAWRAVPRGLSPIYAVAVSPDGRLTACGRGNTIAVYHLPNGKLEAVVADPALAGGAAHRDMVESLAFSPDGATLASGGYREVKLWRRAPSVRVFDLPPGPVATTRDGRQVAVGRADGTVAMIDAGNGTTLQEVSTTGEAIRALAFDRDGDRVAAVCGATRVVVIASGSGRVLARVESASPVNAVAWVSGAADVAAACDDGCVRMWKLSASGRLDERPALRGHVGVVTSLAVEGGGSSRIVSGGTDGTVRVWSLAKAGDAKVFRHGAPVLGVAVRGDFKRIASAGGDGSAVLWNTDDGRAVARIQGDGIAAARVARAGRIEALAAADVGFYKARVAAAEQRRVAVAGRVAKARNAAETAAAAAASAPAQPAGKEASKAAAAKTAAEQDLRAAEAALAESDRGIAEARAAVAGAEAVRDRSGSKATALRAALRRTIRPVRSVAFSSDGTQLFTSGDDGAVQRWDAGSGALVDVAMRSEGALESVALCGNDRIVVGRINGDGGKVCRVGTGWALARTIGGDAASGPFADRVTALDFAPDGGVLAAAGGQPSRQGELVLVDAGSDDVIRRFDATHSDTVLGVRFSPTGRFLASASADKFVRLTDVESGKVVRSLEGHTGHVLSVAWKEDGHTLASGGADASVRFWDVDAGAVRFAVAGFDKEVTAVGFLGGSGQSVAAGADPKLRVLGADGNDVRSLPGVTEFVNALAATPDGTLVVAGGQDGLLRVWEARSGRLVATCKP